MEIFSSKLQEPYYTYIRDGIKIYEMRVNDEKRKKMKIGDIWKFKNANNENINATLPDLVKDNKIKKFITIRIVLAINHFLEYFSVYKNIKIVLINKWTDLSPFL